jgi:PEGA domain
MQTHRPLFVLTLTLASTLAGGAHAQPTPDASTSMSAAASERARKLYVEGARLFDEGKFPQAYVAFAAAWAIKKHPSIAGNLADCEVNLGKYRDAAEHFRYIVKDTSGEVKPDDKRRAQERLDDTLKRIGVVTFTVEPSGAGVVLDGAALGASPLTDSVFVDPGQHTLEARAEGQVPGWLAFDVTAGSTQAVKLALKPKGQDAVPRPERRSVVPGAVLGGVAGAALVAGIGFFAAGRSKPASARASRVTVLDAGQSCVIGATNYYPGCPGILSTATTSNAFQSASVGLWVGAGAAAVGSVLYFVLPAARSSTPSTGTLRVTPMVSPACAGLGFSGTF